ncbi:recombinase family protein [Yimella lutea]|uniref:recombinase family protein n=1 Tax=Yimella lutea TaxID=587872 RepID=UPI0014771D9B|nr:recombinase family protein [Yimella lutea]
MKASVYVRISQDRAGERAGVDRQREDCSQRVASRGWELHALHEDNDLSAKTGRRRPGFEALLSDIESGAVGVVVAWALDRLQRNRRDELRLWEACQKHNVMLSLVNGADLDFSTAAGRFVADTLSSAARLEVELKSDRQKRAVQQQAQAGRWGGGRRPFGYDSDGMTVRESEAAIVRGMYARFLAGVPLGALAKWLNGEDVATTQERWGRRKGEPPEWSHDTVRRVLLNPRNAGLRAHHGEVVAAAVWPALVPEETWRAAVDKIDGRRHGIVRASNYLLTGLALCGVCGWTVHAGGGARRGIRSYRCAGSTGHFARMADPVDKYVRSVVVARLQRPDARDLLQEPTAAPDKAALRAEANAIRSRLESVAVEFADGSLTPAQLRAVTERLRQNLAQVEGRLVDAGRVPVLGPLVDAKDVEAAWDGLAVGQQRAVIDLLMTVRIDPPGRGVRTFRPGTVRIEWKGGAHE